MCPHTAIYVFCWSSFRPAGAAAAGSFLKNNKNYTYIYSNGNSDCNCSIPQYMCPTYRSSHCNSNCNSDCNCYIPLYSVLYTRPINYADALQALVYPTILYYMIYIYICHYICVLILGLPPQPLRRQ